MDGAGAHNVEKIIESANNELGVPNSVPQEILLGVPNTTAFTQPCDMGIIKDLKNIYKRMTLRFKSANSINWVISRTRACVLLTDA